MSVRYLRTLHGPLAYATGSRPCGGAYVGRLPLNLSVTGDGLCEVICGASIIPRNRPSGASGYMGVLDVCPFEITIISLVNQPSPCAMLE